MKNLYHAVTWYGLGGWFICNQYGSIVCDVLYKTRKEAIRHIAEMK